MCGGSVVDEDPAVGDTGVVLVGDDEPHDASTLLHHVIDGQLEEMDSTGQQRLQVVSAK